MTAECPGSALEEGALLTRAEAWPQAMVAALQMPQAIDTTMTRFVRSAPAPLANRWGGVRKAFEAEDVHRPGRALRLRAQ